MTPRLLVPSVYWLKTRSRDSSSPRAKTGDFTAGRDYLPSEVDQSRPVMVISSDLAESLFKSMADRALVSVADTLRQKQWTLTSLATVVGHLQPDADEYPFVTVPAFQGIARDLRNTGSLKSFGSDLQEKSLLRIHLNCFAGR